MPLNLLLHGARGRMGRAIAAAAESSDAVIAAACDVGDDPSEKAGDCEAIIDFSFHEATPPLARLAAERNLPLVIGTTGHSAAEKTEIRNAVEAAIPVVWAGNYSIGVNTLNFLVRNAARILGPAYEAEIVEMHHHHKKDAPSGTAERLVEILREAFTFDASRVRHGREGQVGARPNAEIGVHAVRGGDIVGEHTVHFCGAGERLELTHKASDRTIFAAGALRAARWAVGQEPGVYRMEDVLGLHT